MSGTIFTRGENPLRADKLNTAFSERVSRHGDTMQGMLTLWRDPSNPFDAATKQYVDRITVPPQGAMGPPGPQGPMGPMGPPGSLTGGTFTGPIYYTATGGTVSRSAQDRAGDELNVFDFYSGTFVSGGNITNALIAALATGKNIYVPGGYVYRLKKQIIVGVNANTPQRLRGDGKSTYFLIEADFDPLATCVFLLRGAETNAPTICDFRLTCAQPTTATNRSDFVTLGTPNAGTGLLGVKYPPTVGIDPGCNRFRIDTIRFSNCWDGIHQLDGTTDTGGWWMRDIEISAYNIGLKLGKAKDFCHLHGWHHWYFDQTVANRNVMNDGQVFCMQFGQGGENDGINISEVNNFTGRILIDNSGGWLVFSNVFMDGDNAVIDHVAHAWTLITNIYFSCSITGPSGGQPTIKMTSGRLQITNIHGWNGLQPFVVQTGGSTMIDGGMMLATVKDVPLVEHTGGYLRLDNIEFRMVTPSAWTVPVIHCGGGGVIAVTDCFSAIPSVGDVGLIEIDTDNAMHSVVNNRFNGWKFTPPGGLGLYQTGGNFYNKAVTAAQFVAGSGTTTASTSFVLHSTGQKTINYYNTNIVHWAEGTIGGSDDWYLLRYNDAGVEQPNTWNINRATGVIYSSRAGTVTTWGVPPTDMPAALGWRAIGVQGVNNITPTVDLITTSDNTTPQLVLRRSRGTPTVPALLTTSDVIGAIPFYGYDGAAWIANAALIRATVTAPWTPSVHDTSLLFYATTGTTVVNGFTLSGTAATFTVPVTSSSFKVGANQIAGARITGWGAATGGSKVAFNAGSATLPQTAAALAQLIADLTTHGMIGA